MWWMCHNRGCGIELVVPASRVRVEETAGPVHTI
jgi:hypothetical protein